MGNRGNTTKVVPIAQGAIGAAHGRPHKVDAQKV